METWKGVDPVLIHMDTNIASGDAFMRLTNMGMVRPGQLMHGYAVAGYVIGGAVYRVVIQRVISRVVSTSGQHEFHCLNN
jgi:hypothetical protein